MFIGNREVLVSFLSLCPRGLLGQICSPGNTYFLTFKLSNHVAHNNLPFPYTIQSSLEEGLDSFAMTRQNSRVLQRISKDLN